MKGKDAALYVGLGFAAIWIYNKFKSGVGAAVDTVTQPLANAYVNLTSGPPPVPQGSVYFPDGSYIAASSMPKITWYGNYATFVYNMQNWQLQPHDANGNYPAIPFVGG